MLSPNDPGPRDPVAVEPPTWGEPIGSWAKGSPLEGCVWRFNAKGKMHLRRAHGGDGTLLVPMWLRGPVQLLMALV